MCSWWDSSSASKSKTTVSGSARAGGRFLPASYCAVGAPSGFFLVGLRKPVSAPREQTEHFTNEGAKKCIGTSPGRRLEQWSSKCWRMLERYLYRENQFYRATSGGWGGTNGVTTSSAERVRLRERRPQPTSRNVFLTRVSVAHPPGRCWHIEVISNRVEAWVGRSAGPLGREPALASIRLTEQAPAGHARAPRQPGPRLRCSKAWTLPGAASSIQPPCVDEGGLAAPAQCLDLGSHVKGSVALEDLAIQCPGRPQAGRSCRPRSGSTTVAPRG